MRNITKFRTDGKKINKRGKELDPCVRQGGEAEPMVPPPHSTQYILHSTGAGEMVCGAACMSVSLFPRICMRVLLCV